ncbi:MAG TPA: protein kinase [Pyrinomonadaceae bacterium]|nr:protein kinase [Pyrinomonadaceae bacterium]
MLHCPICGKHYPSDVQFCPADQTPLQADATIAGHIPADPLIGKTLNEKYRIEERLGIGGMGTVYRARHMLIDRLVAIKVLNQRFVEDDAARFRFQREAKAAGRLQHLNAVAVTDFGETPEGYVYIVMELLEGRTLREIIAKEAPLETARAVSIMLQTSAAVAAAHEAGVIHRDLKPANIFVTQRSDVPAVVKVLDFGIAKLATETLDDDDPKNLTQVGAMIGTPRYMSPEQCNGLTLTPASDVYSLGVIFFEMLTSSVPFSGSSPLAIALKHSSDLPRPPREIVAAIPAELDHLVLRTLEKRPEDRPANASEFRTELFAIAEQLGLESATITDGPDLDMLRRVGRESPSGRLVIDIAKLRENRAFNSGSSELTVISPVARADEKPSNEAREPTRQSFARVDVPLRRRSMSRILLLVGAIVAALFLGGYIALRMTAPQQSPTVITPTPLPTATPTASRAPSPSPSPVASVSPKPSPTPTPEKKKQGKVGSFVNKVKRILKKPF